VSTTIRFLRVGPIDGDMFILPEGVAFTRARQLSDNLRAVIYVADAATKDNVEIFKPADPFKPGDLVRLRLTEKRGEWLEGVEPGTEGTVLDEEGVGYFGDSLYVEFVTDLGKVVVLECAPQWLELVSRDDGNLVVAGA
jgi:hypothetical protein